MTRVFDDPAAFADEALAGFAAAYRNYVILVNGGVVRAAASRPGQVAVVIGGGSGTTLPSPAWSGLASPRDRYAARSSRLPPLGRPTGSHERLRAAGVSCLATGTTRVTACSSDKRNSAYVQKVLMLVPWLSLTTSPVPRLSRSMSGEGSPEI